MRYSNVLGIIASIMVALTSTTVAAESLEEVEKRLIQMSASVKTVKADLRTEQRIKWNTGLVPLRSTGVYEAAIIDGVAISRETFQSIVGGNIGTGTTRNKNGGEAKEKDDYLDYGYTPVTSDFVWGYLLNGVLNSAMGRDEEANEHYKEVVAINEDLTSLVDQLKSKTYNTLVVVDWGRGPEKTAYGPDGVLSRFIPVVPSDDACLHVSLNETEVSDVPIVCDLNEMAQDHMWNSLEDIRKAKSVIGNILVAGGAGMMSQASNWQEQLAAAAIIGIGAAIKASARADTRYCEIMPQRVYLAPISVDKPGSTLELEIDGKPQTRLVLCGINPPKPDKTVQMMYVRLPEAPSDWAVADTVLYANDSYYDRVFGDDLPYILGGRCVCRPSDEVLTRYQQAGHLEGMTLAELENLYRDEGIKLSIQEEGGRAGRHILEGGTSMECPVTGSAGFKRLFCRNHEPYKPKSHRVRELAARYQPPAPATVNGATGDQVSAKVK